MVHSDDNDDPVSKKIFPFTDFPIRPSTACYDPHFPCLSPCIEVGNNWAISAGVATDLDGNPRVVGMVDMGAYELLAPLCAGLNLYAFAEMGEINCDGLVDMVDLAILAANWLEASE